MALHNETMRRERTITSTKHRPKNILGQMKRRPFDGDPLTFHVNGNQHTAALKM